MKEIKTIHVTINEDGTTSNGTTFSVINENQFCLDDIIYEIEEGHLVVRGNINGDECETCNIVASITYKGNTYEVLKVGVCAFEGCDLLTSINIPEGVTSIEDAAFCNCDSLTPIDIPSSVTSIGEQAFDGCSSLTSIDIPSSVTSIGDGAFESCYNLTTVICRAENVPELGDGVFTDVQTSKVTLYVPASALEAYGEADQWEDFGTILPIEG